MEFELRKAYETIKALRGSLTEATGALILILLNSCYTPYNLMIKRLHVSGVSISTDGWLKRVGYMYLAHRGQLLFSRKKKQLV